MEGSAVGELEALGSKFVGEDAGCAGPPALLTALLSGSAMAALSVSEAGDGLSLGGCGSSLAVLSSNGGGATATLGCIHRVAEAQPASNTVR